MQSLSRHKKIQETEILIKESLLQQLSYAVKEIQLVNSKKDVVFSTNEECNSLIVALESIFLHGLKRGILKAALKTVTGADESKPTPSFWHMVCNYTHKSTVAAIRNLSQINTDVGRCRVWIRMTLNQGEIISYLTAMEKDRRALNSSYSKSAFLRDRENRDTACKLLEGLLEVQFQIPTNSSLLNTWSSEPLMLSGIWLPPMKTPLSTGVDVAEKIEGDDGDDDDDDSCSIITSSSITGLSAILALDETQALKMILETPIKKFNHNESLPPPSQLAKVECDSIKEEDEEESQEVAEVGNLDSVIGSGNSLANAHGWSSTDEALLESTESTSTSPKPPDEETKTEDYTSLLEKAGISPSKRVNYEARLREITQKQRSDERKDTPLTPSEESTHPKSYKAKLFKIVRESSLKAQKYTCAGCQLSIGLTFGEARLCYFTGEYYCDSCHLNDASVIPSRLIFNWDFQKYPVCGSAHKYLSDFCSQVLIDIKKLNPKIYSAVQEMLELRELRIQLNIFWIYFYTCREPVLIELQKKIASQKYMNKLVDHYYINDLCCAPRRELISELSEIASLGRLHVINCSLCCQKGFICEICKSSTVIYSFDLKTTNKCTKCSSLYHKTCFSLSKNCPKCKRLKSGALVQSEPC